MRHKTTRKLPTLDKPLQPTNSSAIDWFTSVARWIFHLLRERPIELQQAHQRVASRIVHGTDRQLVDTPRISGEPFVDTMPLESSGSLITSSKNVLDGVEVTELGIEENKQRPQDESLSKLSKINRGDDGESIENDGELK